MPRQSEQANGLKPIAFESLRMINFASPAKILIGGLLCLVLVNPRLASAPRTPTPYSSDNQILAPQSAMPVDVVDRLLRFARVTKQDVILDVGCGEGRVVIAAVKKYGAKGICIEIDLQLLNIAR